MDLFDAVAKSPGTVPAVIALLLAFPALTTGYVLVRLETSMSKIADALVAMRETLVDMRDWCQRNGPRAAVLVLLAASAAGCVPEPPVSPRPPDPGASVSEVESYRAALVEYRAAVVEYNATLERYARAMEMGEKLGPLGGMVGGPWGEILAAVIPLLAIGGAKGAAALRKKKLKVPD